MRARAAAIAIVVGLYGAACSAPAKRVPSPNSPSVTTAVSPTAERSADVYKNIGSDHLKTALRSLEPRIYVPNTKSDSVDVIDPKSMKVVGRFNVGKQPQHITPSWDMTKLYVDNDQSGSLTEIDSLTGAVTRTINVDDPYNLYFTPDGASALVVAERLKRIDFRSPVSWDVTGSVTIPNAGPNHLDFSQDGGFFIVSCEFSGFLVKVDVSQRKVVAEVRVGGKPADVRLSPDGTVFYVANETLGGVSVIDPGSMQQVDFIRTAAGAHGFVVSRDGKRLYVTNRLGGSVSVIDFATRKQVAKWQIGGSPDMGGVSIDGKVLWLSGRYDDKVYAIDTNSGALLASIRVGKGPHGLSLFPQPGAYSLGHTGNYR